MDLGIYIIVSALVGAKLLLVLVDADHFLQQPARSAVAGAVGRRVLRRADPRGRRRALVRAPAQLPTWRIADVIAPGIALRPCRRPARLLPRRLLLRPRDRPCRGRSPSPIRSRRERRHAARRAAASDAALRSRRRADHPRPAARAASTRAAPFPGRTFWGYMLVYGLSRFVIEFFRGDPRGMVVRPTLDVAVHLAADRAAEPRHAVLAVASRPGPVAAPVASGRPRPR